MLRLRCFDGYNRAAEMKYELAVYDIDANGVAPGGVAADRRSFYELDTLGSLVEVLYQYGHKRSDPIVRYAAGALV